MRLRLGVAVAVAGRGIVGLRLLVMAVTIPVVRLWLAVDRRGRLVGRIDRLVVVVVLVGQVLGMQRSMVG